MSASDPDRREAARQRKKAEREWAKHAHPFDRSRPMEPAQQVYDDRREHAPVVVAFTGAADKLGIPAVDFFDVIHDLPIRRLLIRQLMLTNDIQHELGSNLDEILESLARLTSAHSPRVFVGSSLGGFNALLLGTLLRVDHVVAINPITSVMPKVAAELGDDRHDEGIGVISEFLPDDYADIARLWASNRPPDVTVAYARHDAAYASYVERISEFRNVRSAAYDEYSVAHKIASDGTLRSMLCAALGSAGRPEVAPVSNGS